MTADGTVDSVLRSMSHASTSLFIRHTPHQASIRTHTSNPHIYPHCFRVHTFLPCFSSYPASEAVYSTGWHTLVSTFVGHQIWTFHQPLQMLSSCTFSFPPPPFGFSVLPLDTLFSNCYISCIMCTCSGRTIRLIFSCPSPSPFAFSTRLLLSLSPAESEAFSCVNTLFGVVLLLCGIGCVARLP